MPSTVGVNQGGRVVKALDLRSNVRMHTWVRTPFLVWDPDTIFSFANIFSQPTDILNLLVLHDRLSSLSGTRPRNIITYHNHLLSDFCCHGIRISDAARNVNKTAGTTCRELDTELWEIVPER